MRIFDLKANQIENPLGYKLEPVRLSYKVDETEGKKQSAAQIVISKRADLSEPVVDTGRCESIDSLSFVPDLALEPRTRYYWQVCVWADNGDFAQSDVAWFETGKMNEPWQARWITSDVEGSMNLCRGVTVGKPVASARAYVTAIGVYELEVNGEKISEELLAPYCNAYDQWLQVQTYDLTAAFRAGENTLCLKLGDGWAIGRFGFQGAVHVYADKEAALAEIRIDYADGTSQVIGTDESWRATESQTRFSNIYDGEIFDATYDISKTCPVRETEGYGFDRLSDRLSLPVVVTERVKPAEIITTPAGETVLDLGQEITGYLEFKTSAPKGTKLSLYYFEILQHGNYYRDNLRTAKEEYHYTADGETRTVRPHFTFYGFRYVKLEGFENPRLEDFTGCVIHSDIPRTGFVETSNKKVNRLALNALWGQRGNFVDVPTDCPQRDERMGWTGDAQAFSGTACFNMYSPAFYAKFMHDMLLEQRKIDGAVPHVIPTFGMPGHGSCAWADAACVIPWTVYTFYGDKKLLEEQYENMKLWVEWIRKTDETNNSGRLWNVGFHFADWLALDTRNNSVMGGTDPFFIATGYYYYSTSLLLKAAKVLGYEEDVARYTKQLDEIYQAIQKEYFTPNGRMAQTTQTAYVIALFMGFAPKEHRPLLAKLLNQELEAADGKLRTGFVGTAYLNRTLTHVGLNDQAYSLLLNEEYPGWLYEVNMGATTVWERWNSVLPNGMISDTGMNSLNHYAYGAVMEWVYRDVAGINPVEDAPGFRKILLNPNPHYSLPKVCARYNSAMGWIGSAWEIGKGKFTWDIEVPFGAEAVALFPNGNMDELKAAHPELCFDVCPVCGKVKTTLSAGKYHFEYKPSEPLELVISLDTPVSELVKNPAVVEAIVEVFPGLRGFISHGARMSLGRSTLRDGLTHNPMMEVSEQKIAELEEKLAAFN